MVITVVMTAVIVVIVVMLMMLMIVMMVMLMTVMAMAMMMMIVSPSSSPRFRCLPFYKPYVIASCVTSAHSGFGCVCNGRRGSGVKTRRLTGCVGMRRLLRSGYEAGCPIGPSGL